VLIQYCRFCAIDFESAGAARGGTDTPVQVGMAVWSLAGGHRDAFVSYIHTDQPILWSAQKVHGITPADLRGAPPLSALWPEFQARLAGAAVVAHGKGTEKRFLRAFPGHGFGPWIDTLWLARAAWPELPDHSLSALCDHLGLTAAVRTLVPSRSWHDALFDAVASLVLLEQLCGSHTIAAAPVEALARPDASAWRRWRQGR
jgi:DNA polymerase-3 subunit epsilon